MTPPKQGCHCSHSEGRQYILCLDDVRNCSAAYTRQRAGACRRGMGSPTRMSQLLWHQHRHRQQQHTSSVNLAGMESEKARAAEGINRRNGLHSDSQEKEHPETIISWEKLKPNENLLCRLYSHNQPFCGKGFLSDRNPGPLNRISILFPTPA